MTEREEMKLEKVHTASGQLQAHIIKGRLETEGIPVLLQHESEIFGLTVNGMGAVRIMVPEHLAEKAKEILAGSEARQE